MVAFVLDAIPPALVALGKAAAFVGSAFAVAYGVNEGINAMSSAEEEAEKKTDNPPIADTCVGDCKIPPKCKDITEEMRRAAGVINQRFDEMAADVHGMAGGVTVPGKGNLKGHIKAIKQAKNRLSDTVRRAKNIRCPIPNDVQEALDRELPG